MSVGMLMVRHDPRSAALVRRQLADDLEHNEITADSIDNVVLVASELVGNAVRHSRDERDLDVAWDLADGEVIVRVNDWSHQQPSPRAAADCATDGRGLAIVAALSSEWGVQKNAHGKQVWARVPVTRAV